MFISRQIYADIYNSNQFIIRGAKILSTLVSPFFDIILANCYIKFFQLYTVNLLQFVCNSIPLVFEPVKLTSL